MCSPQAIDAMMSNTTPPFDCHEEISKLLSIYRAKRDYNVHYPGRLVNKMAVDPKHTKELPAPEKFKRKSKTNRAKDDPPRGPSQTEEDLQTFYKPNDAYEYVLLQLMEPTSNDAVP